MNDVADRGQPQPIETAMLQESWDDMDDVFAVQQQQLQQQHLLHTSARFNTTAINTSFDVRQSAVPPVQVRETTM